MLVVHVIKTSFYIISSIILYNVKLLFKIFIPDTLKRYKPLEIGIYTNVLETGHDLMSRE